MVTKATERQREGGSGVAGRARNDVRNKLHNRAVNTERMCFRVPFGSL